jgi:hypothetical protein
MRNTVPKPRACTAPLTTCAVITARWAQTAGCDWSASGATPAVLRAAPGEQTGTRSGWIVDAVQSSRCFPREVVGITAVRGTVTTDMSAAVRITCDAITAMWARIAACGCCDKEATRAVKKEEPLGLAEISCGLIAAAVATSKLLHGAGTAGTVVPEEEQARLFTALPTICAAIIATSGLTAGLS